MRLAIEISLIAAFIAGEITLVMLAVGLRGVSREMGELRKFAAKVFKG